MGIQLYTNQFGQQVAVGDIDLGIVQTGALVGILSPNQVTPGVTVVAGAPAKIDTTITSGYVVNFLQAAQTDLAIGIFKRTTMEATFGLLDIVEVILAPLPVVWLLANGTITPGATVYNDVTGAFVNTTAGGNKARGIALDYAVTGQVLRVLITNPLAIAS
jgi:hypothetical protein